MSTISKIGKGRFIALALFFLLGGLPQRATAGLCASLIGDPFQATCENMNCVLRLSRATLEEHWDEIVSTVVKEPLTETQLLHMKQLIFRTLDGVIIEQELKPLTRLPQIFLRWSALYSYPPALALRNSKFARYRNAKILFADFWKGYRHWMPKDLSLPRKTPIPK
jgi:hypothetical protein